MVLFVGHLNKPDFKVNTIKIILLQKKTEFKVSRVTLLINQWLRHSVNQLVPTSVSQSLC